MADGGGLAGAAINAAAQIGSSLLTNRGNKKAQERARAHDINMWDKTNYYNDPKQQMERLRNAGLNPNMVYGGSSGQTAGQANALPGAKAEDYKMNLGSPMADYVNFRNTEAQTDNTRQMEATGKAEEGLKEAQTANENAKIDLTNMSTKEKKAATELINAQKMLTLSKNTEQTYFNAISRDSADWSNRYGMNKGDSPIYSIIKPVIRTTENAVKGAYELFENKKEGFQDMFEQQFSKFKKKYY